MKYTHEDVKQAAQVKMSSATSQWAQKDLLALVAHLLIDILAELRAGRGITVDMDNSSNTLQE